jgi:hypothetical protein
MKSSGSKMQRVARSPISSRKKVRASIGQGPVKKGKLMAEANSFGF